MKCKPCGRTFPPELIQKMAVGGPTGDLQYVPSCPLCALRIRNEIHGLPVDEPFGGEIAQQMHAAAKEHCRKTNQ